jgi:hypothetical protein
MITAKSWWAQQQTAQQAMRLWPNRDDDYREWPILVTEEVHHVIWVEAETAERALSYAQSDTRERINSATTCVSAWMDVAAPKTRWEWEEVYEDSCHSYGGLAYDAHVQARDEWLRSIEQARLEATMVNEERVALPAGQRATCAVCRRWREEHGHEQSEQHLREALWAVRRAELWARDVGGVGGGS